MIVLGLGLSFANHDEDALSVQEANLTMLRRLGAPASITNSRRVLQARALLPLDAPSAKAALPSPSLHLVPPAQRQACRVQPVQEVPPQNVFVPAQSLLLAPVSACGPVVSLEAAQVYRQVVGLHPSLAWPAAPVAAASGAAPWGVPTAPAVESSFQGARAEAP